jgi:hypothetical protein
MPVRQAHYCLNHSTSHLTNLLFLSYSFSIIVLCLIMFILLSALKGSQEACGWSDSDREVGDVYPKLPHRFLFTYLHIPFNINVKIILLKIHYLDVLEYLSYKNVLSNENSPYANCILELVQRLQLLCNKTHSQ